GGGRGAGLRLHGGRGRRGQGQGKHEGKGAGEGHSVGSVGDGVSPAASDPAGAGAAAPPSSPPPLNMYLPTIWIRSTAGWVETSPSPGWNTSRSPAGGRRT